MTVVATLETVLTADISNMMAGLGQSDKALDGAAKNWSDKLDAMGRKAQQLGGAMTTLTAPLALGLGASVVGAVNFDRSMTNVGAVLGKNHEQMAALNQEVLAIGSDSLAGPQAAAQSFYDIVGGVADASTHLAILHAAIDTSEAGAADLGETTSALISIMNSYGFSADQASFASDVLTQTVGKGVGTMGEFAGAMPQVAGLAASLGIGFDSLGSQMAFLTTKGFSASQSATQLRAMMVSLLNPNALMKESLHELGYETGNAAIEQYGLVGAFAALGARSDTFQGNMAGAVGSVEALNGVIATSTPAALATMEDFSIGLDGVTQRTKDIQLESVGAQFDGIKSKAEGLAITLGETLLPMIGDVLTQVTPLVQGFTDWAKANPEAARTLMLVVGAAVLAGPVLFVVGSGLSAIATIAPVAVGAVGLLVSPLGLIVVALAGIMIFGGTFNDFLVNVKTNAGQAGEGLGKVRDGLKEWSIGNQSAGLSLIAEGVDQVGAAVLAFPLDLSFQVAKGLANLLGIQAPGLDKSKDAGSWMVTFALQMLNAEDRIVADFRIFVITLEQEALKLGPKIYSALMGVVHSIPQPLLDLAGFGGVVKQMDDAGASIQQLSDFGVQGLEVNKVNIVKGQMVQTQLEQMLDGETIDLKGLAFTISTDPTGIAAQSGPRLKADVRQAIEMAVNSGDQQAFKALVPLATLFGIDVNELKGVMVDQIMDASQQAVAALPNQHLPWLDKLLQFDQPQKFGSLLQPSAQTVGPVPWGALQTQPPEIGPIPWGAILEPQPNAITISGPLVGPGAGMLGGGLSLPGVGLDAGNITMQVGIDVPGTVAASQAGITTGLQAALDQATGGGGVGGAVGAALGSVFQTLMNVAATIQTDAGAIRTQLEAFLAEATGAPFAVKMFANVTVYANSINIQPLLSAVNAKLGAVAGGSGGDTPSIPHFAGGGYTGGYEGLAYVHPYETIRNAGQERALQSSGRSSGNTYNVYGESPWELARMVDRARGQMGV